MIIHAVTIYDFIYLGSSYLVFLLILRLINNKKYFGLYCRRRGDNAEPRYWRLIHSSIPQILIQSAFFFFNFFLLCLKFIKLLFNIYSYQSPKKSEMMPAVNLLSITRSPNAINIFTLPLLLVPDCSCC